MSNFDWTRFVVKVNINTSLEKLYSGWVTRKGIEEWFLRVAEYYDDQGRLRSETEPAIEGDTYKWLWFGWPDETVERGKMLHANGINELSFSFGKAGNCSITITPYNNEFMVELVQDKIPDTEEGRQYYHLGCKMGWTFYLSNMKSVLEGGIDLRHRDLATTDMVNK